MSENKHTLEPVALTHAAWLEKSLTIGAREAASELRRLHEVEKQRDELLAALENGRRFIDLISPFEGDVTRQIDKAIASVKGQK